MRHPRVFLFDEPLSNLDAKLRVQMRVELKKLHLRLGTTAIYVTHDQVEAMTLGDRVVVMKDGVVQQVGEPLELYNQPGQQVRGRLHRLAGHELRHRDHDGRQRPAHRQEFRARDRGAGGAGGALARAMRGAQLTLGIRPEDLHVASAADPAGLTFPSKVEVVEQLGSEILLDMRVGDDTMVAAVEPTTRAKVQDQLPPGHQPGAAALLRRQDRGGDLRMRWGQTPRLRSAVIETPREGSDHGMTRINRAIELLEQDQAIYYMGLHTGHVLTYAQGKEDAHTWADYINVGMEHGSFDMPGLAEYMRGLVDGGPTNSGHRTPAVIVEPPVRGTDEASVRNNDWQLRQILARGVHGIVLCQAESADAVCAFVAASRYPHHAAGVDPTLPSPLERMRGAKSRVSREGERPVLGVGTRGRGSEPTAAAIWGLSHADYMERSDPWPLNPKGELLLGVKIESPEGWPSASRYWPCRGSALPRWGRATSGWRWDT